MANGRAGRSRSGRAAGLLLGAFAAAIVIRFLLQAFVVQAFYIPSGAMLNTLQVNDRILANKLTYRFRDPLPGEIVVFQAPQQASPNAKRLFVMRVVGVGGDTIAIRDHKLYRNGRPVPEPYLREPIAREVWPDPGVTTVLLKPGGPVVELEPDGALRAPPGYLMVCGDNRNDSNDSLRWEAADAAGAMRPCPFVPRDAVFARAVRIFYPSEHAGPLRSYAADNAPSARVPKPEASHG